MFKKLSSLGRAALLAALVLASAFVLGSCQASNGDTINNYFYSGTASSAFVDAVKNTDPIYGAFRGSGNDFICKPDFALATASSSTKLTSVEDGCITVPVIPYGATEPVNSYYKKDSDSVYVVYNNFDGSTVADKHSGVIIFKAKDSPYGSPAVGCYYGVKFQFFTKNGEIPSTRLPSTDYSDSNLMIEGGYSPKAEYNSVTDLAVAVKMFAFENDAYFSTDNFKKEYCSVSRL